MRESLDLSVVVPIYNERDNIRPLVRDTVAELDTLGMSYEILLVDDGSTDGSAEELDGVALDHPSVRVIHFAYNCGQTLAIAAGMDESTGRVIVPMDGDRQNDPADIGRLIAKLAEGYACVSGWRKDRQDAGLRRLVSRAANRIINGLSGVPVHDLGCTLKAYRAGAIDPRELFGEMHRFLPQLVMARGGRVTELVVKHHPRTAGQSKYGFGRIARVVSDIVLIRILLKYRTRPSHLFAKLAQHIVLCGLGVFLASLAVELAAGWSLWWVGFLTAVILATGSVVLLGIGWACELIVRTRYLLGDRPQWTIARRVNFPEASAEEDANDLAETAVSY